MYSGQITNRLELWNKSQNLSEIIRALGKDKIREMGKIASRVQVLALPLNKGMPLGKSLTFPWIHFLYKTILIELTNLGCCKAQMRLS